MNKLKLKPVANPTDYSYRQYFKDDNGRLYCIEPNEHNQPIFSTASRDGEPCSTIGANITLVIDGQPKWRTSMNFRGMLEPAEITLEDVCQGHYELTEEDKESLLSLLGKRLRAERKNRLKGRLKYAHLQQPSTVYRLVSKRVDMSEWQLWARQDYDWDLKVVRDEFIGR